MKTALQNVIGAGGAKVTNTEGLHGNPIAILETVIDSSDEIDDFFFRLNEDALRDILSSMSSRIDESCNLFLRLDKQAAFKGSIMLGKGDDVISVRIRVRSFPSKCEVAKATVREFLEAELRRRSLRLTIQT